MKREKYDLSLVTCQHKSSLVHSSLFRTMIVMYVMTEWKCTFDKPPSPKYCSLAQSLPFIFAHDYQPSHISLGLKAYTHYGLLSVTLRYFFRLIAYGMENIRLGFKLEETCLLTYFGVSNMMSMMWQERMEFRNCQPPARQLFLMWHALLYLGVTNLPNLLI